MGCLIKIKPLLAEKRRVSAVFCLRVKMKESFLTVLGESEHLTVIEKSRFICYLKHIESEEDAKRLVEHLRKNNLGRASFLPITSVKGKKIDKIKGSNKDVVGIASDLIKYNKKYEQIILNLLGRTVIVNNMDSAIKLAKENSYTFRIVTLDGDLINPSGAITGGSVAKKTVNILGRSKEIEKLAKEIESLKLKISKLERSSTSVYLLVAKVKSRSIDLILVESISFPFTLTISLSLISKYVVIL